MDVNLNDNVNFMRFLLDNTTEQLVEQAKNFNEIKGICIDLSTDKPGDRNRLIKIMFSMLKLAAYREKVSIPQGFVFNQIISQFHQDGLRTFDEFVKEGLIEA